ncbi:hypothetical protein D9601_17215 [Sphingomonas sp. MA1305]|mgnify:CR=1 FL=1|uniref:hypothetical protein n=1 Tax=Sphingomonas sp. MA1305 TaxID=2479204 RepID=UPI0018DF53E5|nr:hypothetical protein [Sphingomonas sp. MA1305]MBI0477090.1 hypothetical protein [Sphingomonas sp. MA1305]
MERPPSSRRRWREEDDADLRARIGRRQKIADIAREIGRTVDAVRGRAAQLGLQLPSSLRPWRPGVPRGRRTPGEPGP